MSRTRQKGPVAGNLVTWRLIARVGVASGQTNVTVDRIPMPQGFRVCRIGLDARGTTASASARIADQAGNALCASTVVSSGTPKEVLAAAISNKDIAKGSALLLQITTDGSGVIAAGQVVAHVTGYFTEHITNARFQESGQGKVGGPATGRYDCIELTNLAQVANAVEGPVAAVKMPYACRVMAICYNVIGHTEASASISARIRNATSGNYLHSVFDVDTASGDVGRIDATTGITLTNRDVARGDVLELHVAAGVGDVVPICALGARLFVWVKGQPDFTGVSDEHLQGQSGQTPAGPVEGGYMIIPFINRRSSNATFRVEDMLFLPMPFKITAVSTHRNSSNSVTRNFRKNGVDIHTGFASQGFILHKEGNQFPAPGNWAGNILGLVGTNSNLDEPAGNFLAAQDLLQFGETGAGDSALNTTAHVIGACRGHFYDDPAND